MCILLSAIEGHCLPYTVILTSVWQWNVKILTDQAPFKPPLSVVYCFTDEIPKVLITNYFRHMIASLWLKININSSLNVILNGIFEKPSPGAVDYLVPIPRAKPHIDASNNLFAKWVFHYLFIFPRSRIFCGNVTRRCNVSKAVGKVVDTGNYPDISRHIDLF